MINEETACDADGNLLTITKKPGDIVEYSFDLKVFEERYNFLIIKNGTIGLMNAK